MSDPAERKMAASEALRRINDAWLNGRIDDLASLVHPDIVMVFPRFGGRSEGRDALLAGFRDFCESAKVSELIDHGWMTDVIGDCAVVSFGYDMLYEREGGRYRTTGRDLWMLRESDGVWIAIWRTMLDVTETPA